MDNLQFSVKFFLSDGTRELKNVFLQRYAAYIEKIFCIKFGILSRPPPLPHTPLSAEWVFELFLAVKNILSIVKELLDLDHLFFLVYFKKLDSYLKCWSLYKLIADSWFKEDKSELVNMISQRVRQTIWLCTGKVLLIVKHHNMLWLLSEWDYRQLV